MGKKISLIILSLFTAPLFAADLLSIYNEAAENNATFLAAEATYKAAGYGVPIARASLLPSLTLAANTTGYRQSPGDPNNYNSNSYTLTLTQPLLNIGSWYSYSQAEATYKQAAVTYAQALQTLITNVASSYFGVLEAQDQFKYAQANQASLQEQLIQTEAQYKVGLKALTDVQSTRAQYESAVAQTIADQNALNNAEATLAALIGKPAPELAPLKQDFPLLKPDPATADAWVNYGLKNNLSLQDAQFQSEINRLDIKIAETNGAAGTTTGYLPTVNFIGTYMNSKNNNVVPPAVGERVRTGSAALSLNWNIFNGGSTYATVKQNEYTYQSGLAGEEQTRRTTISGIEQAYLNVLSDISQIQANQQAVISGQASLKAIKAGYLVGTRTIVDVLTQQSELFNNEQQYATSIYQYINDSLNLKLQAGVLSPADITAINGWLVPEAIVSTQTSVVKTTANS